jgi:hypothetical protein
VLNKGPRISKELDTGALQNKKITGDKVLVLRRKQKRNKKDD